MVVSEQRPANVPGAGGDQARGVAIDSYLFHEWFTSKDLAPYLRKGWREFFSSMPVRQVGPMPLYIDPLSGKYRSPYPEDGLVGLDFDTFKAEVLDAWSPGRVVLGYDESVLLTASSNVYAAREVIRAINDWTADAWLSRDERLHGLILVSGAMMDDAVKEIRRLGRNDR